ncbi:MAG: helix-hairpin-helix domain-containing protein [Deltaproteobacteria bacterium]|nr:helix-hairpin-helix domain-containing protein [Deltaproteobacteria bacterium]
MENSKGKETDGKRACLLVSLILLVWNIGAFGRHFLSGNPSLKPVPWETVGNRTATPMSNPAADCAVYGMPGKPTARQRLLLGRKIDINRADVREISDLPGISESVARAVVETRNSIGGFRKPEDLLLARGIKEKRLKKILPFLARFPNN